MKDKCIHTKGNVCELSGELCMGYYNLNNIETCEDYEKSED